MQKRNASDPHRIRPDRVWEPSAFQPPSATLQVEFGADSRRGGLRDVNEDHYAIIKLSRHQETLLSSIPETVLPEHFDEYGYGLIVADGMGGTGAGEAASRFAITTLLQLARHFGKWNLRVDDGVAEEIMGRAHRFYRTVDAAIVSERQRTGSAELQTTMTAVFGAGRDLFFAHVGHSRAYLLRHGELLRLTRDQTIGRDHRTTVAEAPLVDVNVSARDLRHILTGAIGMRGSVGPTVDLERFQLQHDDVVLVCTNGLTDALDEAVISGELSLDREPQAHCRRLTDLAIAAGGEDDVTALVARYRFPA